MSTKIERLEVHDVRFPTAADADGSDSINRADYSACYVELFTDGGPVGTGFTFTGGRGNEICAAACRAYAHLVVGRTVEEIFANPVEFWRSLVQEPQIRWLGPEKGATHMAVGAIVNAVWDLRAKLEGKPMWQLLAEMDSAELAAQIDYRHIVDELTPPRPRPSSTTAARATPTAWRPSNATASPPTRPRSAGSATPTTRSGP
ncbi:hypothetical protein GCM10029992_61010 [Glycomyces albus]